MDGKEPVILDKLNHINLFVIYKPIYDNFLQEYGVPSVQTLNSSDNNIFLDDAGFNFINKCIQTVESRGKHYILTIHYMILRINLLLLFIGLDEQGLYRVGGVSSKITKLLAMGLDRRKTTNGLNTLNFLDDSIEWETKTITSALKLFLRNLPEPLMTFKYHNAFISSASKIYANII